MGSKRKHKQYLPSPPEKRGLWTRIIGDYQLLPPDHPVTMRLIAAGMGPPAPGDTGAFGRGDGNIYW